MAGYTVSHQTAQAGTVRRKKPLFLRLVGMLLVSTAFAIAIGIPLLLSGVTGFNLWQGEGHSMEPTFYAGDFLITRSVPVDSLDPGDIVLFEDGTKHVMHRVVGFGTAPDGQTLLITRGDNNPVNDPPVPASALVGKMVYELSWLPKSPVDLSGTGLFVAEWLVSMVLAATGLLLMRSTRRPRRASVVA